MFIIVEVKQTFFHRYSLNEFKQCFTNMQWLFSIIVLCLLW